MVNLIYRDSAGLTFEKQRGARIVQKVIIHPDHSSYQAFRSLFSDSTIHYGDTIIMSSGELQLLND